MSIRRREALSAGTAAGAILLTSRAGMAQVSGRDFPQLAGLMLRVVHPGQGYTKDLRPDRLTVFVDEDGRITDARIM